MIAARKGSVIALTALVVVLLASLGALAIGSGPAGPGGPRADTEAALIAPSTPAGPGVVPPIGPSGARLVIPSIGVDAPIVPESTTGSGSSLALTIPKSVNQVAWFEGSPPGTGALPGAPGDALLAGHVDSASQGPGALYELSHLSTGADIEIVGSNGQATVWTASGQPEFLPKAQVADKTWANSGSPSITIVTCGGPFDTATGHYVDNVLVHATEKAGGGHA